MRRLCLLVVLIAGSATAVEGQPYGCWSILDHVERLACFDMALGPPAATAGQEHDPAPSGDREPGPRDRTPQPSVPDHR